MALGGGDALLPSRIRIHGNVVGRLAHAQGLTQAIGVSPGRFVGNILTWGVILVAAVKNLL